MLFRSGGRIGNLLKFFSQTLTALLFLLTPLYAQFVVSDEAEFLAAITALNTSGDSGTITFALGVSEIEITSTLPDFTNNNILFDGGDNGVTLRFSGSNTERFFDFTIPDTVNFKNLTVTGVDTVQEGTVAISYFSPFFTLNGGGSTFTGNSTSNRGGVFSLVDGGGFTFRDVTFRENAAEYDGGALFYARSGSFSSEPLTITYDSVTFEKNRAATGGAVVFNQDSNNITTATQNIIGSTKFLGNEASGGMGIYSGGGAIQMDYNLIFNVTDSDSEVIFEGNKARLAGGAIRMGNLTASSNLQELTLNGGNIFFIGNLAGTEGGAICMGTDSDVVTATLNASFGDILFAGNKSGVDMTDMNNPVGGTPNSIHLHGNTTLELQGSNNIYFDDPISSGTIGNNRLVVAMTGSGFVQFDGASNLNPGNTAGRGVAVTSGEFRVLQGGSFTTGGNTAASNFTVGAEGRLAGGGTITSAQGFVIAGTIAPDNWRYARAYDSDTKTVGAMQRTGSNIGTLTLAGDVVFTGNDGFNDGSITEIELHLTGTERESDSIAISGNITIEEGAELHIADAGSSTRRLRRGDNFLVIAANENQFVNTGQEFTLNGNWGEYFSQAFDFNGTYGTGNGLWIIYNFSGIEFETIYDLATRNALNVALALEWMQEFGDDELESIWTLYNSLVEVSDEPEHLAAALTQLHGEVFASSRLITANMQRSFQRRLPSAYTLLSNNRSNLYRGVTPCAPCGTPRVSWNRWASFTGDWQERGNLGDFSGYSLRSTGIIAGFDRRVSRNAFGGIAFGYDNAYQKFDTIPANNQMNIFRTILYGGIKSGTTYADGYAGYTKNWHKTRRDITIDTFEAIAQSKYHDNLLSTGFEIGRRLSSGLTPSIGLHYIHLSSPSITETGADDANLHIHSNRYHSLRLPIGAKVSRTFHSQGGIIWTPEARAYYIREMGDPSARATTSFNNIRPISFTADTGNWGRNSGRLGVGLNAGLTDRFNLRVDYDCEVYDYTSTSEFGATVGVTW